MSGIAKAASPSTKRPYRMVVGRNYVDDLVDGNAAMSVALQGAKTIYYCEGNAGLDTNNGTGGWEDAFKTLTVALAASQADISADKYGWAARNVILCRGDAFDEDLVLLAQKTDVIGLGSYDANQECGLIGNHVPTGAANSGLGTRFFNFFFQGNAAGGDIWTLDSTVAGLEFHGCIFHAGSTTAATAAIVNTASSFMGLHNCDVRGLYTDAAVEFGAGVGFRGTKIIGNYIEGANNGIELSASTTPGASANLLDGVIAHNVINVAGITIDDNADIAYVYDNRLFSAAATIAAGIDVNKARSAVNYFTNPTVNMIYPTEDAST